MLTNQAQPAPVMFCHDSTNIYYPTAPGRVYIIGILALADCDGSDEDYSDSTARGSLSDMFNMEKWSSKRNGVITHWHSSMQPLLGTPRTWPTTTRGINDEGEEGIVEMSHEEVAQDFADALESWADWCDRDSVRLDSLDEIMGAIERAA